MHSFTKAEFYREKRKNNIIYNGKAWKEGGQVPSFASMKLRQCMHGSNGKETRPWPIIHGLSLKLQAQ
jgi:hypothetical protein